MNTKTTKSKKPTFSFTVKLSKWRCGGRGKNRLGKGVTELLNSRGYMCCLGFACLAAGINETRIKRCAAPGSLFKYVPFLTNRNFGNSQFSGKAMDINDSLETTVTQKIKELKKLGAKHNIGIKFVK